MRVDNFLSFFPTGVKAAQQASPMGRLASMLSEETAVQTPLEAAKQALLEAKSRLDQQRDERIEQALAGYRTLRSRQTSYENELDAQQNQLESFQALSSHYDALSEALTAAKAETCAAAESPLEPLSLRVTTLEQKLAAADQDLSALVERANRYANAQKQYAAYLEKTDQGGYAAYQYRDQPEFTRENFVSETTDMIGRMEAGVKQWRERVSSYCEQRGFTPYDFERYLQERHKLSDAYFAAQQRFMELSYAADGAPAKRSFDTVQLSGPSDSPAVPEEPEADCDEA